MNSAHFFPIGWPQLLAYARSQEFYDTTLLWQWMRLPGNVVFALGALLMAWDFHHQIAPAPPWFRREAHMQQGAELCFNGNFLVDRSEYPPLASRVLTSSGVAALPRRRDAYAQDGA
jgi:hypothetical protein